MWILSLGVLRDNVGTLKDRLNQSYKCPHLTREVVYIPRQVVTSAKVFNVELCTTRTYFYFRFPLTNLAVVFLAFLRGLFRKDCKTIAFQYKRSCRRRRKNQLGDWRASIRSGTPKVIGYLLKFQMERQSLQLIVVLDSVHRWPPIFCESFFSAFPAA